jgi:hypothetical protein
MTCTMAAARMVAPTCPCAVECCWCCCSCVLPLHLVLCLGTHFGQGPQVDLPIEVPDFRDRAGELACLAGTDC